MTGWALPGVGDCAQCLLHPGLQFDEKTIDAFCTGDDHAHVALGWLLDLNGKRGNKTEPHRSHAAELIVRKWLLPTTITQAATELLLTRRLPGRNVVQVLEVTKSVYAFLCLSWCVDVSVCASVLSTWH